MAWKGNGMGAGHLPCEGGYGDQPAILLDAMEYMERVYRRLESERKDMGCA